MTNWRLTIQRYSLKVSKASLDELTIYKGSLDTGNGKVIPLIIRVEVKREETDLPGIQPADEYDSPSLASGAGRV